MPPADLWRRTAVACRRCGGNRRAEAGSMVNDEWELVLAVSRLLLYLTL